MKKILVLLFSIMSWSEGFSQALKAYSSPAYHNIAYGKWSFIKGTNLTDTLFDPDLHNADDVIRMAGNGTNTFWNLWQFSSAAAANRFIFNVGRARGTNASPSAVTNGDFVFSLIAKGYTSNGTGPTAASFNVVVDGTPIPTAAPMAFTLNTLNDAQTSVIERFRISATGRMGLGVISPSTSVLAHLHRNQNAATVLAVTNNNTGTSSSASIRVAADSASISGGLHISQLGANFAPSGLLKGLTTILNSNGANFVIRNLSDTEPIQFATGSTNTEKVRITAPGSLLINSTGGANVDPRGFYNNRSAGRNKDSTTKVTPTGIHEILVIDTTNGKEHRATIPAGGGGSGDVAGPASSTDNAIARYDGTTGKIIQNSGATVDDAGNITASGGVSIANSSVFSWAGRSWLRSFADGNITLSNTLGDDFNMLQFGGIVSGYPALKRSGAGLVVRDAADGVDAPLTAASLTLSGLAGTGDRITAASATGQLGVITVGSGLSLTGGTLSATGGGSVTASNGLTLTGSDVKLGGALTGGTDITGQTGVQDLRLGTPTDRLNSLSVNADADINIGTVAPGNINIGGADNINISTDNSITLTPGFTTKIDGSISYKIQQATDANFSATTASCIITLPTITANRTLSLPATAREGMMYIIINTNSSGNTWDFGGGSTLKDNTGASVTTFQNQKVYILIGSPLGVANENAYRIISLY